MLDVLYSSCCGDACRRFRLGVMLLLGVLGNASASKVVKLYNAWPSANYAVQICGSWNGSGFNGPGTSGDNMPQVGDWYTFTLPSTYKLSGAPAERGVFFSLSGWNPLYSATGFGTGQTSIDIGAVLQSSDTVWVVPAPLPNGTPKLYGSAPRQFVVMLLNPWETDSALPLMRSEGGAYGAMTSVSDPPKWLSATVLGYSKISLLFRNAKGTEYFGAAGKSPIPADLSLDSLDGADTIWIRPSPEPSGLPVISRHVPKAKMLMLFNPWGTKPPIQRPKVTISGNGPLPLYPNSDYCGWYSYPYYDIVPKVVFSTSSGATLGNEGLGGTTAIDASKYGDTTWIALDTVSGKVKVSGSFTGLHGLCATSLLAATIRDFASSRDKSSPLYNREFGRGPGCWKGGWSVVRGMVDSVLGSDRKPVRSAHDTGAMYPNSWTYAFRCTYDTSKPATKAEIGDSGLATNWFRTVPEKNAETCRDIPLALDTATGYYVYDNQKYFPIDDFKTLADGSPNPYRDTIPENSYDPGGAKHNYGFCLESHGNFEYKKNQVFHFAGDDDVWFFINHKLVVDLGGIHGTAEDSIKLDNIGRHIDTTWVNGKQVYDTTWNSQARLVEGKTYDFDFFFCERDPTGSDMKIITSMNMRTDTRFQVRDTLRAVGSTSYDLYVSITSGQGCKARTDVAKATGIVRLSGPPFAVPKRLGTGTWFGGIVVDSASGHIVVDSSAIVGLPAGSYNIQFVYLADTSVVKEYTFVVPYTAGPRFVATPAYVGIVGSSFPVDVGTYNVTGKDSGSVQFVVRQTNGLSFYKDSLLTVPVTAGDTLMTGKNTLPRRFWVRGNISGSYVLVIGKIADDSSDAYASVVFQDKGLRFLDSTGAPLSPIPAIDRLLGDTVRVWFETYAAAKTCAVCGDSVRIASASSGLRFLDTLGHPASILALSAGRGSALVTAVTPVSKVTFVVAVVGDSGSSGTWSPVSFRVLPPDSAEAYDRDGDGGVDSFVVHLHQKWAGSSSLSFGWPDTSTFVSSNKGTLEISSDSLVACVVFPAGTFAQATAARLALGKYSWGGEDTQFFSISDRVAPVAMRAQLSYGRNGAPDTLDVSLSEKGKFIAAKDPLALLESGTWASARPSGLRLSENSAHLLLFFDSAALAACPVPGDSVKLLAGLSDTFANAPAARSWSVVVEGGQRPPRRGWYFDRDGDGAIDHAVVLFPAPVRGDSLPTFTFGLPVSGKIETRTGAVSRFAGDSARLVVSFEPPFSKGVTAFNGTGLGSMQGGWNFDIADSVAPAILSAALHLTENYTDPDTLVVTPSEALRLDMGMAWIQVKNKDSVFTYAGSTRDTLGGNLLVLIAPTDPVGIRAGDSLRYVWNAAVQDAFGNIPLSTAIWHPVTGGTHRPISKLVAPTPLVSFAKDAVLPIQATPLQILATRGDTSTWYSWLPGAGYASTASDCPTSICNGPEIVLNSPVSIAMHIYDQLGVHVAGTSLMVDSSALESLERDRLGRTRVRIAWDYRTDGGARVADGVYLLRLILIYPAEAGERQKMVNQIWKIGLTRSGKP